jgi:hypothetical protein
LVTVTLASPVAVPVGRSDCVGVPAATVSAPGPELPTPLAKPPPLKVQKASALAATARVAASTAASFAPRWITVLRSR